MEKLNTYSALVQQFLQEIANDSPQSQVLIDEKTRHFQLMRTGYDSRGNYFFRVPVHIHIREDAKICILENTTDIEIGDYLIEHNVPKNDILPAFLPENARRLVGFAI
jgi:hypothetical protein